MGEETLSLPPRQCEAVVANRATTESMLRRSPSAHGGTAALSVWLPSVNRLASRANRDISPPAYR